MGDRYPSDWNTRRKKVYKRDNYRCQRCGTRGGGRGNAELHAHHKTPISEGGSHRYGNLTTVCKSCHEDIHGHGVGGSGSANSSAGTDDVDPVAAAVSVILVVGIAFLALTYGAVTQVLPAGQAASEDYTISYASVTEDPDGYGRDYEYNVGPPLQLQLALADNVISQTETTQLTVRLHNPSDIHFDGTVDVRRQTSYYASGSLKRLSFDLAPGETTIANTTVSGEEMIAKFGSYPYTVRFNAQTTIYTDSYRAISTSETAGYGEEMQLKIRKPLFNRFGLYWLMLLVAGGVTAGYVWRRG